MKASGELVCFGYNVSGQCAVLWRAALGHLLLRLAAAGRDRHTYAMKASGELVCFGYDVSGQRAVRLLAPVLPPHEDYSYDQVCRLGPGAC